MLVPLVPLVAVLDLDLDLDVANPYSVLLVHRGEEEEEEEAAAEEEEEEDLGGGRGAVWRIFTTKAALDPAPAPDRSRSQVRPRHPPAHPPIHPLLFRTG